MLYRNERGFSLLILIFALAVMGFLLAGFGQVWRLQAQREKEVELLEIGRQFSAALESYRKATPSGYPDTPSSLSDLVEDKRFPYPVHHLRKLFRDPFTGLAEWKTRTMQNRIVGVSSYSERSGLRSTETLPPFVGIDNEHSQENRYCDWIFIRSQPKQYRH